MTRALVALAALVAVAGRTPAADTPAAPKLPPSEETAKDRLNASPRHGEWIDVDAGGTPVHTWLVYPERRDKAPVVVVIHEIFGLTDWIRGVADQLAAEGFIAVAPDLLSGKGPKGGGTDAFASRDDAVKAVSELSRDEVAARLNAVRSHTIALPAANGRSASIGFCWGGATSFAWAMKQPELDAAVVYYGPAPQEPGAIVKIKGPVLGFYGGADERVNATVEPTRRAMTDAGNRYDTHIYDGAGHGFLRAQSAQDGANLRAAEKAWPETVAFLERNTR
jgi:carboxymethylenebutenolidase